MKYIYIYLRIFVQHYRFFLSFYFSVITTRKSVNFEQLSKLPWRGRPVGGEWNTSSLKFSGFRERVVRGISVPNFVEIRDLSELSCMSLMTTYWEMDPCAGLHILAYRSTTQPYLTNLCTQCHYLHNTFHPFHLHSSGSFYKETPCVLSAPSIWAGMWYKCAIAITPLA